MCGDLNVNFLTDTNLITLLLQFYIMFHTIDFPTRTTKNFSSATESICIDYCRVNSFEVVPSINGCSDHDAQHLVLNKIFDSRKSNKLSI